MSSGGRVYDVPPLGEPFVLRGARDVAVVLDVFTPTHLDAWTGRAVFAEPAVAGTPSRPPLAVGGDLTARAVVVRHAGDVRGRRRLLGPGRLDAVRDAQPPPEPVVGIVVEAGTTTLLWLAPDDPAVLARDLSRADWRAYA